MYAACLYCTTTSHYNIGAVRRMPTLHYNIGHYNIGARRLGDVVAGTCGGAPVIASGHLCQSLTWEPSPRE
jgi:hypothetical protein